jgi:hypothetical protein
VRIMAVTLSDQPWPVKPVQPLFDTLERHRSPQSK